MLAIRILVRVLTAVCAEAKNGMVKRVGALRGQQGFSNKGSIHSLKYRLQLGGKGGQDIPGRV